MSDGHLEWRHTRAEARASSEPRTEYVYVYYHTYTMKTKLTVTVDRDLLPRAKRYARARGVSLSSLIEAALRDMAEAPGPTFSERWRGKAVLTDSDDPRYQALVEKYG